MAAEEDAVKVCVRVRPIIQRERGDQVNVFWKAENSTISQIDGTRSFHFDRVFDLFETTAQVYQEVAIPIIRSALHGYNGTIFAYGQTSSGKTYTMMGSPDCLGIIPQAVKEIFRIITEIPSREFLLRVSYMEIYNETVTDLLCDSRKKKPLEIREDFNRNVYVADLNEELVTCPEHVLQWIKKGEKNRHYGETKMNEHSSRSHTIFRMIVESRKSNDPGNLESSDGAVMVSHLNLVDLAGSERTSQTGAEGVRLKEGCNINRSLFILGQVIKKLSDDQPGAFINYRDSKLTRILQNSLGGNTKTVIICTITSVSLDETLSTLQFASAAKNVKNKPHVNEVLDDEALLKRYRKEITDLKKQLDTLEASSVSKAHAMANEEHAQLLAVIQQLQKEREERISNLKNVVVDSARSQEDQQLKRKRRVTWGAEKIQSTLYGTGVFPFDAGSKISASFPKRPKLSDLQTIPENDDSVCTEFSETDETAHGFEDFFPDWDVGNKITLRGKTAFHHSMIDLDSDAEFQNGHLLKDCSSPSHKELEQKLAELENRLQSEVIRKESFEKETLELKKQLEAKEEEKDELVKKHQLEITTLKDQLQNMPEVRVGLGSHNELEDLDSNNLTPSQVEMNNSQSTQTDQVQEKCVEEENLSSHIHDICQEQIQMLEQKIADLETSNPQTDFVESLQICEALMMEKETALSELAILRENFDGVVVENESMKQEIATMEKYLQEKNETSEFELLEKETQKEHEAQLIHEIGSLKKVVKNAELYNQELEGELSNKSKVLKEQENLIAELKKDAEVLLNKSRYSDLSISMGGDSEKIFEEVLQLKQSLGDAETVTRDAQREAAFLRSENIELKEKMDELTLHCQQREKDASSSEKQLESEKSNYKQMQSDLQKELQCAFNEINQLNGLLAGRVPKDLLSRVELDKKITDCSKQLTNALEEKNVLEKEMSYLSELKFLPSENEQLKNQVKKTSDELQLLKNEKEQSESIICDQNSKMQEQMEQIDRLIEEVRNTQAKFQQAEQQYSELTILYEDLQTRCLLTDEEIRKKDLEAEGQVTEINDLKHSLEIIEGKLSSAQQEREELVQAQQDHSSHTSSIEETLKSMVFERDNLQEELSNLSSLVETLQQQAQKQSELLTEKQDLEQKHLQLMSEKEQLQEQLNNSQPLPSIMETERSEGQLKLRELQEKITLLDRQRDELQSKVEELTSEKNILKQDLNDNIEMSIETQDELRTTQEELKCQKQLVSDLKKQISDYAERISVQAVSYEDTTEASEANSDAIGVKKMELGEYNLSLISEMEVLKESLKSAELALATMEEEKRELMQKLDALEEDLQSVTEQRDELENTKNNLLVEKDGLQAKVERAAKQVCELNEELQFSPEKRSHEDVMGQDKEKLLETLKAVTDERDQLKLDLNDNIEMSIETQEELRNALSELKEKSRLFDALKSQVDGSKGQTSNLEKNLEVKILDLEEKLHAAVTERDQLSEELRFLTEQKRNLEEALSATKHGLLGKETQDKEVQVLTEVLVDEEEMNVSTRLEVEAEQNILKEQIDHLQQQIHIISQERGQYLQLIDTLKSENLQLVSVMQRETEDRAAQSKETEDLASLIETLKGQLETTSQQLTLREHEAKEAAEKLMQLNDTDKNISGLEMLERNLQQSSISMEKLQEEKLELSDKLCALQEELEKVTCYRENLQSKLEIVLDENASLKEIIETSSSSSSTTYEVRCQELQDQGNVENGLRMQIPGSVSVQDKDTITDLMPFLEGQADLEEQLLQKTSEYEQLLQLKDKLEEDQNSLSCKVEGLTNRMTEAQTNLESLQNEKHQSEEQLLHLQQKLDDAVQDRDDLKIAHERLIDEMDQLKKNIKEKSEMDLCLQERLLQRTSEYEQLLKIKNKLEEENGSLNCEVESLTNKITEAKKIFESMQNEKHQTEAQLVDLKQKLNVSVQDGDDLKIAQEGLIAEIELLKRNLKENDDMVLHLKQEIQQRTECQHEELEQSQHTLKNAFEQTMNDLKSTETQMEALRSEKLDTEKKLICLQHTMEIIAQERDDLKASQENLILERDQLKEALEKNTEMLKTAENQGEQTEVAAQTETLNNMELDQLLKDLKDMESQLASVQREKVNAEENFFTLQKHMEEIGKERDELQATLQSLQFILQSLQSEKDQLKEDLRENIEMLKTVENQQEKTEVAAQTETLNNIELDQLLKDLNDMESQLASVQREKVNAEEKFSTLQKHMEEIGKERDELQGALQSLQSEKDQLKEDLRENILMSIETQEDLRSTQEELQQQRGRVSELTGAISSLEQKSSSIEMELNETATVLKEVTSERDDLDQCKQKLTSKVEQLLQQIKDKEVALCRAEREKSEVSQKIFDLSSVLSSMAEEKDLLNCSKEDVEKQSVEMQNDLRRTQEELQQQNQKVETLTSEISLLEEKCSSLQNQLQEQVTLLKRAVEEKEVLGQAKQKLSSNIEQLLESLKSKDTMLELTEGEKRTAAQKVIELTEEVRNLLCKIEELQLFKENLEKEATKLREDFKQLQLQHAEFNEQETQKSARLEQLTMEVEQLKEKVTFKEAAAQQLEADKADLRRQVQQYELEVASLHQEQEQFQQLLQRVRGEKENIYTNLQDQEKDKEQLKESLTTCQTELESVKKQRDESKDHVAEKVNEINAMLQQLSSLQQQLEQLHQELKGERLKNNDLNEKVDDLEKEIRVFHLLQNEPVLEEDELAQRTESLQIKNQEFKDLMVTVSSVYANQLHLLSNLSVELQDEVEAQKQSLGAIQEAMSSTHFKSLESLQTEYFKLNSQMQTLLNKFKVIYRNATVKEEHYSLVNGYDNELCVVQKKNDELLLQCQSLEQNGTKWSESAAEELKFCELEFLNHLLFKKMDVIKRVEDGFSEVQISLNSVEGDLTEEVKSKKKFLSWLEECKGLHFDAKHFSEGIIQENRRISVLVQLLSKKLKAVVQSRIKQDTVAYLRQLDEVLQEKKEKNKELLQKMQLFAPSGDSNILEEENTRLCEKLKNLQAELKKMQCRIQQLENEVTSAKADAKQKGEKASCLQERLLSSVTETALSEMQAKVSEKEKHLETALKEIKALQEKVAQGAAPYRDEMDRLKDQVVKFEMDRIKLSKSTDQQIASLKSSLEYKEECLRKLKEQLRRSQKDVDTTICSDKNGSTPYPLTCGGGSGIVQSTTMLVLQSENASLKREITHYRKKWHQLSRNTSTIREDESKLKDTSAQTPSHVFSPLAEASQSSSEVYKQATVSPPKSDIPLSHIHSPGNTGMHRKRAVSPSKTHKPKPQVMSPSRTHVAKPQVMSPNKTLLPKSQVMSPNKTLRHSVPVSSPGKTGPTRKRAVSPFRTEGKLFSSLTESPRKKLSLPEPADFPKDNLFEWSKSLQYYPSKFFDNSTLGTLPDAVSDPNSAIATETNDDNNWWDRADKNKNANECKTS